MPWWPLQYARKSIIKNRIEVLASTAPLTSLDHLLYDIDHCWTLLKNHLTALYPSASTTTIIDYLESTWLYSTQYPRDMWSMYQSVLDNDPGPTMYLKEGTTQLILQLAVPTQQSFPLSRFYKDIRSISLILHTTLTGEQEQLQRIEMRGSSELFQDTMV